MAWTTTQLLASIKRRADVPTAQASYSTTEILSMADEETRSYVVPLVLKEREDYWVSPHDVALVDGTIAYRIPYRAVGGKLREVYLIDVNGNLIQFPRARISDLEDANWGFWTEGNVLNIVDDGTLSVTNLAVTLRMYVYLRPNALVATTAATTVSSFNATAKTITLASTPSGYAGQTTWDIVRAKPGFETLAFDAAGTLAASTITFTNALPDDLAVGDYVCLPEQTPVPQIPAELHDLLAQRVAVVMLSNKGMADKLVTAEKELARLQSAALALITPRVEGESVKFVQRRSLFRGF